MLILAAGAHVLAGGLLPQPAIVAGIVALVLAPVTILSKTKISMPAMIEPVKVIAPIATPSAISIRLDLWMLPRVPMSNAAGA